MCSSGHQDTLSSLKSIPTLCDCVLPGTSVCWPVSNLRVSYRHILHTSTRIQQRFHTPRGTSLAPVRCLGPLSAPSTHHSLIPQNLSDVNTIPSKLLQDCHSEHNIELCHSIPPAAHNVYGLQVRVWWEATAPPREEDGAAFYPAKVVRNITGTADDDDAAFVLEFATGECTVSAESVFPFDNPVAFGGEQEPLQVGLTIAVAS